MKKIIVALSLILAACVQQPTETKVTANPEGSAPDTDAQQRARAFTDLAGAYFQRAQYKIALDELRKNFRPATRVGRTRPGSSRSKAGCGDKRPHITSPARHN